MLHIKFQAPAVNGSKEEDFLTFLCISMVQTQDLLGGASLEPETVI